MTPSRIFLLRATGPVFPPIHGTITAVIEDRLKL
jgi:hypothetical protein